MNHSKNPERIAQIIGKMWSGVVEAVVFNYYRAIDHNRFQFDFYYDEDSTVEPPQDLINMGARFYRLPPYQRLPQYLHKLRKYLKAGNYRIVQSHLNTISVFPLYTAWREGIPVRIAHNHSVPGGKETGRNALKWLLKRFSRVFANEYCACSEAAGRWLFGDNQYKSGKITVLKNAIDFSKFNIPDSTIRQKRKELNLQDEAFVVGHIGRFTAAKNHHKVISVFASVKKLKPDAVLLLIGDGEERNNIENWVKKYGLVNSVKMTGKVSDPQNYYPLISVLILPSIFEGVPVTIAETQCKFRKNGTAVSADRNTRSVWPEFATQIAGVPCIISDVVNKDVVISDGCRYMSPDDSDERWAEEVV